MQSYAPRLEWLKQEGIDLTNEVSLCRPLSSVFYLMQIILQYVLCYLLLDREIIFWALLIEGAFTHNQ